MRRYFPLINLSTSTKSPVPCPCLCMHCEKFVQGTRKIAVSLDRGEKKEYNGDKKKPLGALF